MIYYTSKGFLATLFLSTWAKDLGNSSFPFTLKLKNEFQPNLNFMTYPSTHLNISFLVRKIFRKCQYHFEHVKMFRMLFDEEENFLCLHSKHRTLSTGPLQEGHLGQTHGWPQWDFFGMRVFFRAVWLGKDKIIFKIIFQSSYRDALPNQYIRSNKPLIFDWKIILKIFLVLSQSFCAKEDPHTKKYLMGKVKLIWEMLLTACGRPRRNLCYLI